MIDAVTDPGLDPPDNVSVATPHRRGLWWLLMLVVLLGVTAVGAALGRGLYREAARQRNSLKQMRDAVEGASAPGEVVAVDDALLGWALRRGSDGVLRQSVWTVRERESAASVLAQLRKANRREMVLVATPDDRLVQSLDAAGFTVAQEVGWVPWDLSGSGRALLGRGKMRIYFVVAPREKR